MDENDDQPKPLIQPPLEAGGSGPASVIYGGPLDEDLTDKDRFVERGQAKASLTAQGPGGLGITTNFVGPPRMFMVWAALAGGAVVGVVWVAGGAGPAIGTAVFMLIVLALAAAIERRS